MASDSPTAVYIVHTGTANLASVVAAFERAGVSCAVTDRAKDVEGARALVLPGVGSFGAAMAQLREHKLVRPLQERFAAGKATLAICLGLQVLCEASEESPGVAGLGVLPGLVARRFSGALRVPQLGWNVVQPNAACTVLTPGCAYFANSYKLDAAPAGWSAAWTTYGGSFVSAIERSVPGAGGAAGVQLACQFHPELSGRWGAALIGRWLASAGVRAAEKEAVAS